MVRVINNNLWTPVPWGWGCGGHSCNGGGWMNNMLKYQFMFGMMNNISNMFRSYVTPPQQQYNPYGMMGGYNPYGMMGLQLGSSVLELMDKMNEYIDQNPDKFKDKVDTPEKTGDDGGSPATKVDDQGMDQVVSPDKKVEQNKATVKVPSDWHHKGIDQKWYNDNFVNPDRDPTAANVLDVLLTTNNVKCTETARKALLDDLITYNPSCFDKNTGEPIGGIENFNYKKLDIPPLRPNSSIDI